MSFWLKCSKAIEGRGRASGKARALLNSGGSVSAVAGKHAVEGLTKVVAIAPGASNTRIITWRPTTVETELFTKIKGAVAIRGAALLVGGGWTAE